jgi:hypothetical protein
LNQSAAEHAGGSRVEVREMSITMAQRASGLGRRGSLAALLAVGMLLMTAGAVFGAGPVHTQDTLQWDDEIVFECEDFDILATSQDLRRNIVTWYDETGAPMYQRRVVHFDFTLVNTASGAVAEDVGHFVINQDFRAGAVEQAGALHQLRRDGRLVLSAAGHAVFTPESASSVGHLSPAAFEERLCAAMA